jgi:CRISPR-associated protein Csd1
MIQELLDFADAESMKTPAPLDRRRVQYFLDLDLEGNLIGVSPTCGRVENGREELGKDFECPVFFPLKLSDKGEVISNGGGGNPVAELLTGDTMEIFDVRLSENGECVSTKGTKDEERRKQWLKLHDLVFRYVRRKGRLSRHHEAVWKFVQKPIPLSECLDLFDLPNPTEEAKCGNTADDQKKLKEKAEKARKAALKQIAAARFAFRVAGKVTLKDRVLLDTQREHYGWQRKRVVRQLKIEGSTGNDSWHFDPALAHATGCLTPVFPNIAGVPVLSGGPNNWCPLASFDKAPFKSYGLDSRTLPMRLETAERAAAALNYLLRHDDHHLKLGGVVAIFWTVPVSGRVEPPDFIEFFDKPDALEVRDFLRNIWGHAASPPQSGKFYCALLSSPKARITVRAWHDALLPEVSRNVDEHFDTVSLPDLNERGSLKASTLTEMAKATVSADTDDPPLQTKLVALFNTTLFGRKHPLPHAMLGQVIERQAVELTAGHENTNKAREDWNNRLRHRTAFIRLFFNINQGKTMNEETILDEKCKDPAILCGRLLALLDKIHGEAHVQRDEKGKVVSKGTASSPANRFYRSAAKTPALVFPRLLDLARDHLAKVDKDWAYRLEFGWQPKESEKLQEPLDRPFIGLAGIVEQLKLKNRAEFPRLFSLEEQGRFALGFYYERCRRWPPRKERQTNNNEESNKD